jgi:hypothetical protein
MEDGFILEEACQTRVELGGRDETKTKIISSIKLMEDELFGKKAHKNTLSSPFSYFLLFFSSATVSLMFFNCFFLFLIVAKHIYLILELDRKKIFQNNHLSHYSGRSWCDQTDPYVV